MTNDEFEYFINALECTSLYKLDMDPYYWINVYSENKNDLIKFGNETLVFIERKPENQNKFWEFRFFAIDSNDFIWMYKAQLTYLKTNLVNQLQ